MTRPFRNYPIWMLQAIVKFRRRKTAWLDAYEELVMRGQDIAEAYAKKNGSAWVVVPPRGLQ